MSSFFLSQKNTVINEIKIRLDNRSIVSELQMRLDEAEQNKAAPFSDFTDVEMLLWYLYRREHLNQDHEKSERTVQEYKRELLLFIQQVLEHGDEIQIDMKEVVEGSLFKSLEKRHIRRYQEWLATKSPYVLKKGSYSPATLSRKTAILRSFLRYLFDQQYISEPIHEGLFTANVRKDDRPNRDLGPNEVVQLLRYFKGINHPIVFGLIHVLTTTGIRNEELCRLTVKDLKYDSIHGGYYLDVLGKGNKRREIPLKEKVVESIRAFRNARGLKDWTVADPNDPLFTTNTHRGYSPSYLSQYLTKMIHESGLPFISQMQTSVSPHVFRHSLAIISYMSKADIYLISRSLGHEKIETTVIYLQKIIDREQHAIHKWEDIEILGGFI